MAFTVRWRFDDHTFGRFAGYLSGSCMEYLDLEQVDRDFHKHNQNDRERPVMMWLKSNSGEQQLGPIVLKGAMAHLLQNIIDTKACLDSALLCNASLLKEHGASQYEILGKVKGASSMVVIKSLGEVLLNSILLCGTI